jgi:hypothetical protein
MSQSVQFYGWVALLFALSVAAYVGLRRTAPVLARILLALGGALAGSFLSPALLYLMIQPFRDGWNLFGLMLWGVPILFVGGGIAGFFGVLRWTARSAEGRRKLNIALCSTVLLTPIVLFALPRLLMIATNNGRPDDMHERSITVDQFTASPLSAAFVVPTARNGVRALVFVDRVTRQARLIGDNNYSYGRPHFSWDGERLLFVGQKQGSKQHDLVSCIVKAWQCRLVIKTDNDVLSPVEIAKDVIIYSSSPLITVGDKQRYNRYEFYAVKVGADPIQLSNFPLIASHSINVVGDRLVFSTHGSFIDHSIISTKFDISASRSEIFEWTIDRESLRIPTPTAEVKPRLYADGFSVYPAVSEDGRMLAFQNTELGKGSYRFNLMAVDTASGSKKLIKLEGNNFSRAAFAGQQMLYNELLNDRYRVRAWNFSADGFEDVYEIAFSKIYDLEHINLTIAQ